jgi:flagellar biosynthesis GTPase FlhF
MGLMGSHFRPLHWHCHILTFLSTHAFVHVVTFTATAPQIQTSSIVLSGAPSFGGGASFETLDFSLPSYDQATSGGGITKSSSSAASSSKSDDGDAAAKAAAKEEARRAAEEERAAAKKAEAEAKVAQKKADEAAAAEAAEKAAAKEAAKEERKVCTYLLLFDKSTVTECGLLCSTIVDHAHAASTSPIHSSCGNY